MRRSNSAPTKPRSNGGKDGFQNVHVIGNAQLIGDREKDGVCLGDCFIFPELLDKHVRLGSVAPSEDSPCET